MTDQKSPTGFATLLRWLESLEKRVRVLETGGRHPERDRSRDFARLVAEAQEETVWEMLPRKRRPIIVDRAGFLEASFAGWPGRLFCASYSEALAKLDKFQPMHLRTRANGKDSHEGGGEL